ncbi:MAG TPA: MerR family transcriptional regulator [Steroidobacteraceae bacterium]|nr:MerR family transcriptional regulator [Steroidobacteraceae bacterium]
MPKPKRPESLSAVACARRTGLTVRALRVYERNGLIAPTRSGKGWRLYGPKELQRLNVIVTLKTLGMTLAQIRSLLKTRPPPLARVLEMQLRACRARRDGAQQALELVQAALATIESGRTLTLEELCNLTRGMEMGNQQALTRELINEQITPHEERAYTTWVAARAPDEIKAMQEYGAAVSPLFRALQALREAQVDPAAAEAQELITEWNAVAVRCGLRAFMAALLEWNPAIARKWLQVGERAMSLRMAPQRAAADESLWAYFGAAQEAAAWHRALRETTDAATELAEGSTAPDSAPARALAQRVARICAEHALGDPQVYARWAGAMQFRKSAEENARMKRAWAYLASALAALPRGAS